jgi:hypothetical protein
MQRNPFARVLAVLVALWTLPALAGPNVIETSAFKITLPSGWSLESTAERSKDGKYGMWVLAGPVRGGKMYIRIGQARPGPLSALWNRFLNEVLADRILEIHPQYYWEKAVTPNTETAFGSIYGVSRRNEKGHMFKFAVIAARHRERRRIVYAALGGTQNAWGRQIMRLERLLESLELK